MKQRDTYRKKPELQSSTKKDSKQHPLDTISRWVDDCSKAIEYTYAATRSYINDIVSGSLRAVLNKNYL